MPFVGEKGGSNQGFGKLAGSEGSAVAAAQTISSHGPQMASFQPGDVSTTNGSLHQLLQLNALQQSTDHAIDRARDALMVDARLQQQQSAMASSMATDRPALPAASASLSGIFNNESLLRQQLSAGNHSLSSRLPGNMLGQHALGLNPGLSLGGAGMLGSQNLLDQSSTIRALQEASLLRQQSQMGAQGAFPSDTSMLERQLLAEHLARQNQLSARSLLGEQSLRSSAISNNSSNLPILYSPGASSVKVDDPTATLPHAGVPQGLPRTTSSTSLTQARLNERQIESQVDLERQTPSEARLRQQLAHHKAMADAAVARHLGKSQPKPPPS